MTRRQKLGKTMRSPVRRRARWHNRKSRIARRSWSGLTRDGWFPLWR